MLIVICTISYAQSNIIEDDLEKSWAKEQIKEWLNNGLVNGYPDNSFKPKNNITRAEFIAIVNRALGFTKKDFVTFSDVDSNKWYYNDVARACSAGYISGYENNKFQPEKNISRQEVAAILFRLLKLANNNDNIKLQEFKDFDEIPKWSREYLNEVVNEGYITDYYPKYTYLHIKFLEPMEAVSGEDLSNKVSFNSSEGDSAKIEYSKIGKTCKECVLFIVKDNLKLNTNYKLPIPRGTIKSVSGKSHDEDIDVNFKTAHRKRNCGRGRKSK